MQESSSLSASLGIWFTTQRYNEQCRFLQIHPELLSSLTETFLETSLAYFVEHPHQAQLKLGFTSSQMIQATQDLRNRLYIIRYIHARGNTAAAILDAYVDVGGAFVLDLPPWLDTMLTQLDELAMKEDLEQNNLAYIDLLSMIIGHAQQRGSEVAPEVLAELRFMLGGQLRIVPKANRSEACEVAIEMYTSLLSIFTSDRYPYQYARIQGTLGNAYKERIGGEGRDNQESAIACYTRALQAQTLDAFPKLYAITHRNLGDAYRERIEGDRRANLNEAIVCYNRALQVYTLDTFPEDYAMIQSSIGDTYSDLRTVS
jgi:tetratricopeptide (TPR) repeat protein